MLSLEARIEKLEQENRLLLDRLLSGAGYQPLTPQERSAMPKRDQRPVSPMRRMAYMENKAWREFEAQFPANQVGDGSLGHFPKES